jgi:hypothetical protein
MFVEMYYAGFLALIEGKILFERFFSGQKDWNPDSYREQERCLLIKPILSLQITFDCTIFK